MHLRVRLGVRMRPDAWSINFDDVAWAHFTRILQTLNSYPFSQIFIKFASPDDAWFPFTPLPIFRRVGLLTPTEY